MHILIFPVGLILWYLAYEAKPIINDEYNEVLLDNLESDFSEETDWIQRIKEG